MMEASLQDFINFLHENGQINMMFMELNPVFNQRGERVEFRPAGDYFIYQKDSYQPKFWSYSLAQLLEIMNKYGGMITDKNNQLLYIKYPT